MCGSTGRGYAFTADWYATLRPHVQVRPLSLLSFNAFCNYTSRQYVIHTQPYSCSSSGELCYVASYANSMSSTSRILSVQILYNADWFQTDSAMRLQTQLHMSTCPCIRSTAACDVIMVIIILIVNYVVIIVYYQFQLSILIINILYYYYYSYYQLFL